MTLEDRMKEWVISRIGVEHMNPRERAMRLLEEAIELAQAEGVSEGQVTAQARHVFNRPAGDPESEAGGVAVCLLAWCASREKYLQVLAELEMDRIESKPVDQIRGSVARKQDSDLVTCI